MRRVSGNAPVNDLSCKMSQNLSFFSSSDSGQTCPVVSYDRNSILLLMMSPSLPWMFLRSNKFYSSKNRFQRSLILPNLSSFSLFSYDRMPSFLCLLWGPALIKLPLLDLFLTFATDWRAGLSSAQPFNFYFLGKSCICASNVLKLAPKLTLFFGGNSAQQANFWFSVSMFRGTQLELNFLCFFLQIRTFCSLFLDQIPIFSLVTKFQIIVDQISIFCLYLWIKF